MHWGAYEVFSVLSGIVFIGMVFLPTARGRDRLSCAAGGIAFIGYGVYVAGQDSGTFVFPSIIFVLPFLAVGYVLFSLFDRGRRNPPPGPRA
ncbi:MULTISPECIES: hypothetical protein [unclassified Frankia]|uniref:hypothetical protein n=1 Tax=unclassified Frankia TaxID=2632575 RepID=UPI0020241C4A